MDNLLKALTFKDELIPAVIIDASDGQVLTLCYMNREALQRTLETRLVHVFRRSKGRLMLKGESSGHTQKVMDIRLDCAGNSLLVAVEQTVAACHAGFKSCYYRRYDPAGDAVEEVEARVFDPEDVY